MYSEKKVEKGWQTILNSPRRELTGFNYLGTRETRHKWHNGKELLLTQDTQAWNFCLLEMPAEEANHQMEGGTILCHQRSDFERNSVPVY